MSDFGSEVVVGIEAMSFFCSRYWVDMQDLAEARGLAADHYVRSLGQERMAVPPPGEDAVTLAANAADQLLSRTGADDVELFMFATESGVDQAKAGGMYVHGLLDLPTRCRVFELKQACYAATAGLQMAAALVRSRPQARVLVVATDIAKYGLGTAGEPTQGACAAAFLVSARPQVLELDPVSGVHAEDVMDFWRPNYRKEAMVDGTLSVRVYNHSLQAAWKHYQEQCGRDLSAFRAFCFHMPFTRMASIAFRKLCKAEKAVFQPELIADSQVFNRVVGNSYTASVYLGLQSLLQNHEGDLTGRRVGLFSYGSGSMGEFFSGTVGKSYAAWLEPDTDRLLQKRARLSVPEYEELYRYRMPEDGSDFNVPDDYDTGQFRLAAGRGHKPVYERVNP